MVFIVCVVADIVHAHVDQIPFAGAFDDTGFKIGGKYFGQEGENLKLHEGILA